jgi:hypothetical protein
MQRIQNYKPVKALGRGFRLGYCLLGCDVIDLPRPLASLAWPLEANIYRPSWAVSAETHGLVL